VRKKEEEEEEEEEEWFRLIQPVLSLCSLLWLLSV